MSIPLAEHQRNRNQTKPNKIEIEEYQNPFSWLSSLCDNSIRIFLVSTIDWHIFHMNIKIDIQTKKETHTFPTKRNSQQKSIRISNAHGWIDYIPFVICIRYYLWAAHKSTIEGLISHLYFVVILGYNDIWISNFDRNVAGVTKIVANQMNSSLKKRLIISSTMYITFHRRRILRS